MPLKRILQLLARRRQVAVDTRKLQQRKQLRAWLIESLEERSMLANVALSAGNLLVTDPGGLANALTMSISGTNIRLTDPANAVTAGAGVTQVSANTVSFPASSLTGRLDVDLGAGNDTFRFTENQTFLARQGISVKAETITVSTGATLSTRIQTGDVVTGNSTANSGDISFVGQTISVNSAARLLSHVHAGSTFTPGKITIDGRADTIVRESTTRPPAAKVTLTNALVRGGEVSITAAAQDRFGVVGFKKEATSDVTIDRTTIDATSLALNAIADTSVEPTAPTVRATGPFRFNLLTGGDTITRTTGSWLTDGFLPGQSISVQGTLQNNGSYVIESVTATTIKLIDEFALVNEVTTAAIVTGDLVLPRGETIANLLFPFIDSALFSLSKASANVQVIGNSVITTSGTVNISSIGESNATPFLFGLGIPTLFDISAAYAESDAKANASIEGTSRITAGGKFNLTADTVNIVTANTMSLTRNRPVSLTFAGATTKADTDAFIGSGTRVTAAGVDVLATTSSDVQVSGTVVNSGSSGVGAAVGYNHMITDTDAYVAGIVTSTADVNIVATVDTKNFLTDSDTRHNGSTKIAQTQLANNFSEFMRDSAKPLAGVKPGETPSLKSRAVDFLFPVIRSGKLNLAGAIVVAITEQTVDAYIATGANVKSQASINVLATMSDPTSSSAAAESTSDGNAVGGSVVYTDFNNTVLAHIDAGTTVNARGNLDVQSRIVVPYLWKIDFKDADSVLSGLNSTLVELIFTTFSRNRSAGDDFALSAAANIYQTTNRSEAWIASGAVVNADPLFAVAGQTVNVHAYEETNIMNGAGLTVGFGMLDKLTSNKIIPRINDVSNKSGLGTKFQSLTLGPTKTGIGGSFGYYGIENSARAWIEDGANVKAVSDISVTADVSDRMIAVTVASGSSSKLGVSGSGGLFFVNANADAYIEDNAIINSGGDVIIKANNDPRVYNVVGGVVSGEGNVGIGASIAHVDLNSVTRAFVGDDAKLDGTPSLVFNDVRATGAGTVTFKNTVLTGNPSVTFTDRGNASDSSAPADTITRSTGSWITDGFEAGQYITFDGTANNNTTYFIESVTPTVITLGKSEAVVTETKTGVIATGPDTITRSTGTWEGDGFLAGQQITIAGTTNNNGTYTIDELKGNRIFLDPNDQLRNLSTTSATITAPDTIRRDGGSWYSDGFRKGSVITITNAGANNGTFVIDEITTNVISLRSTDALTDLTTTAARVGSDSTASTGRITASGDLLIDAVSGQQIYSTALAGSIATPKDTGPAAASASNAPSSGGAAPAVGSGGSGGASGSSSSGKFNIGASADVSVNTVSATTRAFIESDIPIVARDTHLWSSTTGRPLHEATADASVVFAPNGTAADTITRTTGSWFTDGFRPGQSITVSGSSSNNKTFLIQAVTDQVITLATGFILFQETSTGAFLTGGAARLAGVSLEFRNGGTRADTVKRSLGSFIADGFRPGQTLIVQNGGANDGRYLIDKVTSSTISLNAVESLAKGFTTVNSNTAILLSVDDSLSTLVESHSGSVTLRLTNKNSIGLAGSYSDNSIVADTLAYVADATLTLSGNLGVHARTGGNVTSLAASGTGAGKIGIAGQLTNNDITGATLATIKRDASVETDGSTSVRALDDSEIISVAGAVAFGGKAGIGASIAINQIQNRIDASLDDAAVAATGSVNVFATSLAKIFDVTGAIGASSEGMAAAVSLSISDISNNTNAFVTNGNYSGTGVNIEATDRLVIDTLGGGIGVGKDAGFGASIAISEVRAITRAFSELATLSAANGNLRIIARSESDIRSMTVGGGAASRFAFGGSVSLGSLTNTTEAYILGGDVSTNHSLQVSAFDDHTLLIVGGGFAGSGSAAVGLGNATALTTNIVRAFIGENTSVAAVGGGLGIAIPVGTKNAAGQPINETRRGVAVTAYSSDNLTIVAAGGAVSGTGGVAGSASVSMMNETTEAFLDSGARVNFVNTGASLEQDVVIRAIDLTTIVGVGGALAGGQSVGVGAGVDFGQVVKNTQAYVAEKADVKANRDIRIDAISDEDFVSVSASIAAGGSVSIAGSVSVYVLDVTTRAVVDDSATAANGAKLQAEGNVIINAQEHHEMDMVAGNLGGAGKVAVGVAASVPVVTKNTEASIGRNASVLAKASRPAALVPSGDFTVAFVTDVSNQNFPQGQPGGDVLGTDIEVGAPRPRTLDVGNDGSNELNDPSLTMQRTSTPVMRSIKGVSVTAINRDDIETAGASGAASGVVSVNVGGVVNIINITTTAFIDADAKINVDQVNSNAEQDVHVAAANDYYHLGIGAALNGSLVVAVTPSVDVLVANLTTRAFVDDGADVFAKRDVSVTANAREKVISFAGGAALSGIVGVAGSAAVNVVTTTTEAYIGEDATTDLTGAEVRAGNNILIRATDLTDLDVISGAVGVGAGGDGLGVSAAVIDLTKITRAFVGTFATVNALAGGANSLTVYSGHSGSDNVTATETIKGLAVQAYANEDVLNLSLSAGAGLFAGVGAGTSVQVLDSNTSAFIDNNANVNEDRPAANAAQGVSVAAVNQAKLVSLALGGGAGAAAGGVGVDVGIVRNDTIAQIDSGATVNANRDVDVNALASKTIDSVALSGGFGAGAAAGSVSVWAIGGAFDASYTSDGQTDNPLNDTGVNALTTGDRVAGGKQTDGYTRVLSGHRTGPTFAPSALNNTTDTFTLNGHGFATGDAVVYRNGGGASINGLVNGSTYFVINDGVNSIRLASTRTGAVFGRAINVTNAGATGTTHTISRLVGSGTSDATNAMNAQPSNVVTSQTGMTGAAATSVTSASIGTGATVIAGDDINLRADDKIDFGVVAGNANVGTVGAGASIAIVAIGQRTEAFIASGANITAGSDATDDVLVRAKLDLDVDGKAFGGSFTVFGSLAAQAIVVKDNSVQRATIGSNANILQAGGTVTVEAIADRDVAVRATSVALSTGVAVGASIAIAELRGSTTAQVSGAKIGQSASIVRNVVINATNDSRVVANSIAVGGGILAGVTGANATVIVAPTVTSSIAANTDITVSQDIIIDGKAIERADVDASGVSVAGGAAAGVSIAVASLAPTMLVEIGSNSRLRGRNVRQRAYHNITDNASDDLGADAKADAGAGSLVAAVAGADADARISPTINTVVSPGANINITGDFQMLSRASHDANATANGVGIGLGKAGIGAAVADAIVGGVNRSRINDATIFSSTGSIEITADWIHDVDANVVSAAGGLYGAITANRANVDVTSDIDSFVEGTASRLQAGNDLNITARSAGTVDAAMKSLDPIGTLRREALLKLPDSPEELVSHFAKHVGGVPLLHYGNIHYQACEAALTKLRAHANRDPRLTAMINDLQQQLDAKPRERRALLLLISGFVALLVLLSAIGWVASI